MLEPMLNTNRCSDTKAQQGFACAVLTKTFVGFYAKFASGFCDLTKQDRASSMQAPNKENCCRAPVEENQQENSAQALFEQAGEESSSSRCSNSASNNSSTEDKEDGATKCRWLKALGNHNHVSAFAQGKNTS
jgi:hypothetical protein